LGRNGAMRILGLAAVVRAVGVAEVAVDGKKRTNKGAGTRKRRKTEGDNTSSNVILLGSTQRSHVQTESIEVVHALLAINIGNPPCVVDAESLEQAVHFFDKLVGEVGCHLIQKECGLKPGQYARSYLVRLLTLAHTIHSSTHAETPFDVDWSKVSIDVLRVACPEQGQSLDVFADLGLVDASSISFALFNRGDWGLFASMFACLWQDVTTKYPHAEISCESFQESVRSYYNKWGMAAHPCVLLNRSAP
jgi:hypothetical protein